MRYYNTLDKNEVRASKLKIKKGKIVLPDSVVALDDNNPFFALSKGMRLTYDKKDIPNGAEPIPAIPAADILASKENDYYESCYKYQTINIDANLLGEMNKSEALVESGKATVADLPLAKANGIWLEYLWAFYYTEKENLLAGDSYITNFSSTGKVPNNHAAIRGERKSFLGKS